MIKIIKKSDYEALVANLETAKLNIEVLRKENAELQVKINKLESEKREAAEIKRNISDVESFNI